MNQQEIDRLFDKYAPADVCDDRWMGRAAFAQAAAEIRRQAWLEVADLCDSVDKSTHPADLADTIRTLAQSEQEKCQTCNGHGLVGGMTVEGGETWPCPDCAQSEQEKSC